MNCVKERVNTTPNYISEKKYPVLYILHGFYDTQDWMLRDDVALVTMLGNLTASGEAEEIFPCCARQGKHSYNRLFDGRTGVAVYRNQYG